MLEWWWWWWWWLQDDSVFEPQDFTILIITKLQLLLSKHHRLRLNIPQSHVIALTCRFPLDTPTHPPPLLPALFTIKAARSAHCPSTQRPPPQH